MWPLFEILFELIILIIQEVVARRYHYYGLLLMSVGTYYVDTGAVGVWSLSDQEIEIVLQSNITHCNETFSFVVDEPYFPFWIIIFVSAHFLIFILRDGFLSYVSTMISFWLMCRFTPMEEYYPVQCFFLKFLAKIIMSFIGACYSIGLSERPEVYQVFWAFLLLASYFDFNTGFITQNNLFVCIADGY